MHVYRLNISVMTSEIDPEISIIKTHECKYTSHTSQEHLRYSIWAHLSFPFLPWAGDFSVYRIVLFITFNAVLSKAQMLLRDLQELLDWCSTGKSQQMRCRMVCHKYADNVFQNSVKDSKEAKNGMFLNWSVWVQSPNLCLQSSKKVSLCFVSCPHNSNFRLWICPEVIRVPGFSV